MDRSGKMAAMASLAEPLRRQIYNLLADRPTGVSREIVADELGLTRKVVAFHLDKLVDAGLLEVSSRYPPGRRAGPGAGRPAKWYRRSESEVTLSVPERSYKLAAELLAAAVDAAELYKEPVGDALRRIARDHGRSVGSNFSITTRRSVVREEIFALLREAGYEPEADGETIRLLNCPFHQLAEQHRLLTCTMNLELLTGVMEAAGLPTAACLDPAIGRCCVTLESASFKTPAKRTRRSTRSD